LYTKFEFKYVAERLIRVILNYLETRIQENGEKYNEKYGHQMYVNIN